MRKNGDPMQGKNDFRTDHKGTEEILEREKKIFQYKRANAELQTRLGEESAIRKIKENNSVYYFIDGFYRFTVYGKLDGILYGYFRTGLCSSVDHFCNFTHPQISERQETAGAAGADESEPAEV